MTYDAYTYIIKCPNGKSYYGYRSANKVSPEDDLWKVYFTSSKRIKELREQYDDAEFVASVDKTFKAAEEAHEYETKFLTENDCVHSDDWLNEHCFPVFADNTGSKRTEKTKKKMSESQMGRKHTEESKKKISEAKKGVKLSDEHRKSIGESKKGENNPNFGKKRTEETKKKMSEAKKGKKLTEKTKKKLSEAMKGRVPWNKGKTGVFTEAARKKMSEARKGSVPWNKGKTGVYTDDTIKKISETKKGVKISDEHRKSIGEGLKKHHAKKKRNEENVSIEIHER